MAKASVYSRVLDVCTEMVQAAVDAKEEPCFNPIDVDRILAPQPVQIVPLSSFRSLAAPVFACSRTLSGDSLERYRAMLSELREVAWLAGIIILSILGIGVGIGVALVVFT